MLRRFIERFQKKRSYDGASRGRLFYKWFADSYGPNTALTGGGKTLRNRSRDMARNDPWVASALDSLVANITTPAFRPISRAEDKTFRKEVTWLWDDWNHQADASGVLSFDLMVGLALRAMMEAGECFIRIRPRRAEDGLVVPLQLQLIEADHVPYEQTVTPANKNHKVIAGIEFDALGRRVAYWMYPEHPGESADYSREQNLTPVRVPADEVIHLFDPTRPGQIRGVPRLAPVLTRLKHLADYEAAELLKKKISSLFVGAITSPAPDSNLLDEEDGLDEQENVSWAKLEPGTVLSLEPGEDMKFSDPPQSDGTYEPHIKMQLRASASAIGITYEQMTGDLTGVNFSSIRAGLNEFQRRARRIQAIIVHQLCRRVREVWLDQAVLSGAIAAPDYANKRRQYQWVEWRAPGWKYVNPQQEIAAVKEEIKGGMKSRQQAAAEQGQDISEIDEQIAEDKSRAAGLGLKFDTDPDGTNNDTSSATVNETKQIGPDDEQPANTPVQDDERAVLTLAGAMVKAGRAMRDEEIRTERELSEIIGGEND